MFHLHVKYISRRKGQAVVSSAAYRSGERLHDMYYGLYYDFTAKGGVVHKEIFLPQNAPAAYRDRETLWNAVEMSEENSTRRNDARLAREIELSLPVELQLVDQIKLVAGYVTENFTSNGMCADVSIHDKKSGILMPIFF